MRFSTILAATASVFIAQQAGATPSVVDGHLHLLTAPAAAADKRDSSVGVGAHGALPNTRRHHIKRAANNGGVKKVRRGGYCKAKNINSSSSSSGSDSSSSSSGSSDVDSSSSSSSKDSSSSNDNNNWSPSSSSSSESSQPTKESSSSKDSGSSSSGSSSSGGSAPSVSAFQGKNSGVGSWFRTNAGSDSTNGMSWCETKYKDDWNCFAPSVGKMMDGYPNRQEAAKAYCGRQAILRNPHNGKTATAFICDGFDDTWAKRSGNTDLTIGLFTQLNGNFDGNKNTVIMGLEWELTGSVDIQGTFQYKKYE